MSLVLGKTISSTGKTSDVRYITLLYEGSHEGMDGIAHHACTRQRRDLRPTGHGPRIPIQLPLAGHGHVSTLDHTLNGLKTRHKSTPKGPQRHVDRSMTMDSASSSAMEPISATILASQMRRTRTDRSCRSRDTISGHMSDHEEAHGGWRRMG